ncbi:hypothetical protein Pyn_25934 [Prunus yedoensis var. nudiflora]|uniref:Uncharacterized protein n=1 Tax=Prunus yedoensis var. nudiflora TaxID=2094558 RepID=A0A314ZKL7_PRUYE|nr:hypothetical protein Pyn_25934 [Prunus yedoensis var. nudiflora]
MAELSTKWQGEAGPSGTDKGKKLLAEPSFSQEENSTSAFKSPKKRTRDLFEEVQESSEPSVEILGVFNPSAPRVDYSNP